MEVLFATNNPAKIKIYADKLEQNGIELKTLLDLRKWKKFHRKCHNKS